MARYIAFLRAINVGGHTVKMNVLRGLFEDLELRNVETFIASGNVLFDSTAKSVPALEAKIEAHLERELGYEVATFIRTLTQLEKIGAYAPPPKRRSAASNSLYVGFLKASPPVDVAAKVLTYENGIDAFDFVQRELFWSSKATIGTSKISGALLERTLKSPATFRNMTTVKRLVAGG